MSYLTLDKLKAEKETLRQVAEQVDMGDIEKAIELLLDALKLHADSELLLNCLTNLYQQLGQRDIAYSYTQILLNLPSSQVDLPSDSDFDYLNAQLLDLSEEEYSFDEFKVEASVPRKTLSLKATPKHQLLEHDSKSKIVVKNKFKHVLDNNKLKPNISTNQVQSELASSQGAIESDVVTQRPLCSNGKRAESNGHTITSFQPVRSADLMDTKLKLQNDAGPSPSSHLSRDNKLYAKAYATLFDSTECSDKQPTNLLKAQEEFEESEENDIAISEFDWFDDELDSFAEKQIEVDDFDILSFEDREFGNELSLYDFWDDVIEESEETEERGFLADTLTPIERAKLVAVEFIDLVDWDKSTLPFFTEVFISRGWKNIKLALEREVNEGASFEELQLAFEIKTLWLQSSRYWITFSRVYGPGGSTDAAYRHCSWSQALRLVRVFDSVPELEEVYDFLEYEFELWFNHGILRKCFPVFSKYLFNYRLHERNIPEFCHGFYGAAEYEQSDYSWLQLPLSDEMTHLRELGIDLISIHAPKIDYISDKYTFAFLFEHWRSTTPDSERGKDFEDE